MADVSNIDDVIDSRDMIENIEELQDEIETLEDEHETLYNQVAASDIEIFDLQSELDNLDTTDEDKHDEQSLYLQNKIDNAEDERSVTLLRLGEVVDSLEVTNETHSVLEAVAQDARGYNVDFDSGAMLIVEDYFETYARDLAADIGTMPKDMEWPLSFIDWSAAADALKVDYASIDYDGQEYWIRCT